MKEFVFEVDRKYVVHVHAEDPGDIQALEEAKQKGRNSTVTIHIVKTLLTF